MNQYDNIAQFQTQFQKLNIGIGQVIVNIRRARLITQRELALSADLSQGCISRIECGHGARLKSLFQIAQALHLDVSDIFDLAELRASIKRPGPCSCNKCQASKTA